MIPAPCIRTSNQGRALLAGYLAFSFLYLGSASAGFFAPVLLEPSSIDRAIPLLEWSIWPYLTQFLLLPASIVLAANDADRSRTFYAMLLATLAATAVFLIWPTEIMRPVQPKDGMTGIAWKLLYLSDTPRNCFPSLHVALAALSGVALWRCGMGWVAMLWPALIVLSTLTTKQHMAWDVLGGLLLGASAWVCTPRVIDYECTKSTIPAPNR